MALHVSSHLVSILIALNDLVYGFLRKLFKGHHLADGAPASRTTAPL